VLDLSDVLVMYGTGPYRKEYIVNKLKGYGIEEVVKGNSEKSTRVIIDHVI
jgi:hypothetical protein